MNNLCDSNHLSDIIITLKKRKTETLGNNFKVPESADQSCHSLILTSSSDWGVARNGGRRGAQYGPKAILAQLGKLMKSHDEALFLNEVANDQLECQDFQRSQEESCQKISHNLNYSFQNLFHLGGGHDHIYPLLMALQKQKRPLVVINIDAHLDTRTDSHLHSGTPFRQFSQEFPLTLYQVGIHQFANAQSNYTKLKNGEMKILSPQELQHENDFPSDALILLSLDCDGLDSSLMEAVSAVNPNGLKQPELEMILNFYQRAKQKVGQTQDYLGVYEYNPLFDNLSCKGAKFLASLLYRFL